MRQTFLKTWSSYQKCNWIVAISPTDSRYEEVMNFISQYVQTSNCELIPNFHPSFLSIETLSIKEKKNE